MNCDPYLFLVWPIPEIWFVTFSSEFTQMVNLLQSSVWRLILMNVAPEVMAFFRINVFYPKAQKYLDSLLRQLIEDHAKAKKYGNNLILGVAIFL